MLLQRTRIICNSIHYDLPKIPKPPMIISYKKIHNIRPLYNIATAPTLKDNMNDYTEKEISTLAQTDKKPILSLNDKMVQFFLINIMLPLIFLFLTVFLFGRMMKNASGAKGMFGKFSESQAKFQKIPDTGVTFNDVAGCEGAKRDLQEVVDFLKNPDKYAKMGAKIPKGVLLYGTSGIGKTLLSKALAGEAGCPFFSCAGSSFNELFVGMGSARIRSLFTDAAKEAPCVIFIDEIDAVAKKRSGISIGGSDERETTLNQLLVEMDGFDSNKGVIVLAATNRPDILDEALLRPGRFDRKIYIEKPDINGRTEILKVHTKNKPLDTDVELESLSKITAGSSGADLENLANEAAILACRRNKDKITMKEFEDALDKIALGEQKTTTLMTEKQKKIVSTHEAGHTLVAMNIGDYDKVKKVTIIPRGMAGGVTLFEPDQERIDGGLYSKEYLENQLCVALGGRVAEDIVFGGDKITTGASSDFVQVHNIARKMVTDFGFTDSLGPVAWKQNETMNAYSDTTAHQIDEEMKRIVFKAYEKTKRILITNKKKLLKLSETLIEKETMTGEEIQNLFK